MQDLLLIFIIIKEYTNVRMYKIHMLDDCKLSILIKALILHLLKRGDTLFWNTIYCISFQNVDK